MAQTWLVNRRKLRMARIVDTLFLPFLPLLRRILPTRRQETWPPRRILVLELWHIGDLVIAMPFLAALRMRFPSARITLLSKSHANPVLANTGLVDDFVAFDFPWTFLEEDRRRRLTELLQIPAVVRRLRKYGFDLAFDCSRDGRNHLLMYLTGAARRVGFAFGGGDYLLTDAMPVGSLERHRTEDWLRLLEPFAGANPQSEPRLVVSHPEREWARQLLRRSGVVEQNLLIAVHPGGSSRLKRWKLENFVELARIATAEVGARILWIVDPAATGAEVDLPAGSIVVRPSLRELIALLSESKLLVCNDGGPMHLAAALGVPTFSVYSWGKPEWWKPFGTARHVWVQREDITCRPCAGHCIFAEPICLTGLSLEHVAVKFRSEMVRLATQSHTAFAAAGC
jgi:ADP-heptose:LPS heptosyltransferase